ncbi:polysaccharide deacetylase family protein [Massilia sp. TN1-12]|uniref:polysaccharide deacetylase family protein n=1 Tax=Massilia paldalensis TaxID=3377675 RepID=UPI00384BBACA
MKPTLRLLALLCGALFAAGPSAAADAAADTAADRFDVAVTVDDLPVHGPLPRGLTRAGIARSYIETLKRHGVPEAYGFVNGKGLREHPDSSEVLVRWRQAGYPLGNHTFSHLGLSQAPSLQAWLDDAAANEALLGERMGEDDWHWLRYPFLDAGGKGERHDQALARLKAQGYRVADVALGFDDWAYTDAYARCLDKGDEAAIARMKEGYLARIDAQIARNKALSERLYGRVVPQVLLTHLGAWSAATLPTVLDRLDAAGARYVTLAQAQADAAYRDDSPGAGNGALMERKAQERRTDLDGVPTVPPVGDFGQLCR